MKRVAAIGGLAFGGLMVRRYLTSRSALANVAVELRNPVLPFLSFSFNARTLPLLRAVMRRSTQPGRGVTLTERTVGEPAVRVLIVRPLEADGLLPAVLWIHGGGMIVGSPQFEAGGAGRLARELGVVVVSPDYRLAPEHPFPAASGRLHGDLAVDGAERR